jgi:hypothetical protein
MRTNNNWDAYRGRAGLETYTLACLIVLVPKIGALKMVAIKDPTQATEADYLHSVVLSVAAFRLRLARFTPSATPNIPASRAHNSIHPLPNRDLDTGRVVQPGGYSLTDSTYAALLHSITQAPTQKIPPGIKEDIQAYYADLSLPITTKKDPSAWAQVQTDLITLASMPTSTEPEPYPTYGDEADSPQSADAQ